MPWVLSTEVIYAPCRLAAKEATYSFQKLSSLSVKWRCCTCCTYCPACFYKASKCSARSKPIFVLWVWLETTTYTTTLVLQLYAYIIHMFIIFAYISAFCFFFLVLFFLLLLFGFSKLCGMLLLIENFFLVSSSWKFPHEVGF